MVIQSGLQQMSEIHCISMVDQSTERSRFHTEQITSEQAVIQADQLYRLTLLVTSS